jgi:hypothetical protein
MTNDLIGPAEGCICPRQSKSGSTKHTETTLLPLMSRQSCVGSTPYLCRVDAISRIETRALALTTCSARYFGARRLIRWVEAGLWSAEIQQYYIGAILHSFEDNLTAVWRDVEVANVEIESEIGQLPLGARL